MSPSNITHRIRSFVCRVGRMTPAQRQALEAYFPQFGLEVSTGLLDFDTVFGRQAPRILEIGFGTGQSLLAMAAANPDKDFIGIETHEPGVGALLLGIHEAQLTNLRVYFADAIDVLNQCIPPHSLSALQIFFPDPWPKRRHHKRRLIQVPFIEMIAPKLQVGGILHLATDWQDYAAQMLQVVSNLVQFENIAGVGNFAPRSAERPITKFEKRGQRLGYEIWELKFVRR